MDLSPEENLRLDQPRRDNRPVEADERGLLQAEEVAAHPGGDVGGSGGDGDLGHFCPFPAPCGAIYGGNDLFEPSPLMTITSRVREGSIKSFVQ